MDEGHRVATTALSLSSKGPSKVIPVDVSEVIFVRDESVWNFIRTLILFAPGLSLADCVEEIVRPVSELFGAGVPTLFEHFLIWTKLLDEIILTLFSMHQHLNRRLDIFCHEVISCIIIFGILIELHKMNIKFFLL